MKKTNKFLVAFASLGMVIAGGAAVAVATEGTTKASATAGTDTLTTASNSFNTASGSAAYGAASYTSSTTSAAYSTYTYKGQTYFQWQKASNKSSGLAVTTSAGAVTSITVVFNATKTGTYATDIAIYGKNTAYSCTMNCAELYETATQGTLLTTLSHAAGDTVWSYTYTPAADYSYIAFANTSAYSRYIDSIAITWKAVTKVDAASATLNKTSTTLVGVNDYEELTATVYGSNGTTPATNQSGIWASANTGVVTVNASTGLLTAVAVGGPVNVTFTSSDVSTVTATCAVTVVAGKDFSLVTDVAGLTYGDSIMIASSASNFAIGGKQSTYRDDEPISKGTSTASSTKNVSVLELQKGTAANSFAFWSNDGYLACGTTTSNNLYTNTEMDDLASFTVSLASNIATIATVNTTATRTNIYYNGNSSRFSAYATTTTLTDKDIVIYRAAASNSTAWAANFFYALAGTCDANGVTTVSSLKSVWDTYSASFSSLSTTEQGEITGATPAVYGSLTQRMLSAYTYIAKKYSTSSITNFLGLTLSANSETEVVSDENKVSTVVVLVTMAIVLAGGAYLYIRRRKHA